MHIILRTSHGQKLAVRSENLCFELFPNERTIYTILFVAPSRWL